MKIKTVSLVITRSEVRRILAAMETGAGGSAVVVIIDAKNEATKRGDNLGIHASTFVDKAIANVSQE